MKRSLSSLLIIIPVLFLLFLLEKNNQPVASMPTPSSVASCMPIATSSGSQVLGVQTKRVGCVAINSLPDPECTPGAVFPNVSKEDVCVSGYSSSVRSVSAKTKEIVYAEYGVDTHLPGEYEVDHLVSLELGGSNEVSNLWPEIADPRPGYHEKDKVENLLHKKVCDGSISLSEAQRIIAQDWLSFYQANY